MPDIVPHAEGILNGAASEAEDQVVVAIGRRPDEAGQFAIKARICSEVNRWLSEGKRDVCLILYSDGDAKTAIQKLDDHLESLGAYAEDARVAEPEPVDPNAEGQIDPDDDEPVAPKARKRK